MILASAFKTSLYAQRVIAKLELVGTQISEDKFVEFGLKYPALLFPAFQMQSTVGVRSLCCPPQYTESVLPATVAQQNSGQQLLGSND